jgi:KUP system potassium uptake protein
MAGTQKTPERHEEGRLAGLMLAALGVVYGDIGTSPLYAVGYCFHAAHGLAVTEANVLGILSLIFWSLVVVLSIKYAALVMTGAEALYADLGHFGASAIRRTWFCVVLPCLLLNYFGQGALLLHDPQAIANPFFHLVPAWALYPTVLLACAATVIASQAIIAGTFSLTLQAVRLEYLPRLRILHTSREEEGQIYVPSTNWLLCAASVALAVGFGSSSGLAAAYGVAVSATMLITTILVYTVMRESWGWPMAPALAATLALGAVDVVFLAANGLKITRGGWIPLLVGVVGYVIMSTWRRGRELLVVRIKEQAGTLEALRTEMAEQAPAHAPGTAIFLTSHPEGIPATFLQNMRHNHVLHEVNIFLTLVTEHRPRIPRKERIHISRLADHFHRVVASYGFMEEPSVLHVLARCTEEGVPVEMERATFFLGRETVFPTERPGMPLWREWLFAWIARNTSTARREFHIPADRVVELGTQIEL